MPSSTPQHIAFIMDGNRRWAKSHGIPVMEGHRQGVKTLREVISAGRKLGIKYLTFYAFSTENWKRSNEEVSGLMGLLRHYFKTEMQELAKENVRIKVWGDRTVSYRLEDDIIALFRQIEEETAENDGITVNICINYGGRDEILRATQTFAEDVDAGRRYIGDLDEEMFESYLDSRLQPNVDLMVRTGGDQRISNFLLWQLAYAELQFTPTFWPDFDSDELQNIISDYMGIERRFGGNSHNNSHNNNADETAFNPHLNSNNDDDIVEII